MGRDSSRALKLPPGLSAPGSAVITSEFCTISIVSLEHLPGDLVKPSVLGGGGRDFPASLWRPSCGAVVTQRSFGGSGGAGRVTVFESRVREASSGSEAGLRKQKQVSSRWGKSTRGDPHAGAM